MAIRPETTPNPNAIKFTTDTMIFEGDASVSVMPGDVSEHEVMNDLMKLKDVDNVFGYQNFITVNKQMDADWDLLTDEIITVLNTHNIS
ncbi:MAG TPA: NifU N-terminal domain-containing protein [Pseudogracilibacillus sp.]|nr:NifU N-terminal domain-containing protein [Pseudogracilibacillus sp.]